MIPAPVPGLVIRYSYLWAVEHEAGREEGVKDRPCAVVASVVEERGGRRVTVLPVTHRPPGDPNLAMEIPAETKRRLGLDSERSWIILAEGNEFLWPGPDLRPSINGDFSTLAYGFLPPRLFGLLRTRYAALVRARRARAVPRTE